MKKLYSRIDWSDLHAQKEFLASLLGPDGFVNVANNQDKIEGLLTLVDFIEDEAEDLGYRPANVGE